MATGGNVTQHQRSWAADASPALQRIIADDAVGQLWRREGRMAVLGTEDGDLKLDWVDGVARLLADDTALEAVEAEARAIHERGIHHVIWAGMGGSVITVRTLTDLGFHGGDGVTIYPLDSTDPAALNDVARRLAHVKGLALPGASGGAPVSPDLLRELLGDVMMIGVSMGMTSEEPITHLTWFTALLTQAGLPPSQHLLVMTLPDSYLDRFARAHGVPSRPLQLDGGNGTGGRMSAPTTRVFLLPAALYLTRTDAASGRLRAVLERAWRDHDAALAARAPAGHPFVRLAAALCDVATDGACRLLLTLSDEWRPLRQWIEQLMEESLGKGGKGVVVFGDQALSAQAPCYHADGTLPVRVAAHGERGLRGNEFPLYQPYLAAADAEGRLAALAASFLGWQLCMALFGYLHDITFAGQPAVENYKARARTLRDNGDPLRAALSEATVATDGPLTLLAPPMPAVNRREDAAPPMGTEFDGDRLEAGGPGTAPRTYAPEQAAPAADTPAALFAAALQQACDGSGRLDYLDVTMNGELPARWTALVDAHLRLIGNELLGVPVKPRRAPADYHSTEQSEMDGPPALVSLRLLARRHEPSLLGTYDDTFLLAQAVGTWQAMVEQGRSCFLLVIDRTDDDGGEAAEALHRFFGEVEAHLRR